MLNVLRRDLRAIAADGTATSVMMGIGENYLPPFVLAISSSQLASGLVSSVPIVIGAALQMVAPYMLRRVGSYRRWVVLCSAVQGLSLLPLAVAALRGSMPLTAVFGFVSLYWGFGMAGGAAWNAWAGTLVPEQCRSRYFAWRNRLCQGGLLAGFLFGGVALQVGVSCGEPLVMFAVLFAVAAGARLLAVLFLNSQSEPLPPAGHVRLPTRGELTAFLHEKGVGRVFLYMLAIQAAVYVSSPYFPPYMLRQLKLPYGGYMVVMCTAFFAKMAFLPTMGRLVDRWGTNRLLWIGGIALIPMSGLWVVSDCFGYLLAVQVLSGAAWAAYELAMFLLVFETIPREKRVGLLTIYNLANATAILIGSLVGAGILSVLGEVRQAYWLLFLISSGARVVALPILAGMPSLSLRWLPAAIARLARSRRPTTIGTVCLPLAKPVVLSGPHWRHTPAPPALEPDAWEPESVAVED